MKKYIYVDTLTMQERPIEADGAQVTTNGELIFLSSVNALAKTGDDNFVIAAVAPGFWSRFWEEAIDIKRNDDR